MKEIIRQPVETWKDELKNDFEESVFALYPEIAAIKDKMYDLGAVYASMTGSGSAVYGIFRERIENIDAIFSGSGSAVYGIFRERIENIDAIFSGYFCRQREMI